MTIISEIPITNFDFYGCAKQFADKLYYTELEKIGAILEQMNPEGITRTALNDLFWHDSEYIANLIGLTEEEIMKRNRI